MHGDRGMTLIDTIVGSALMLVVFVGIAGVFRLSVDVVANNKSRATAVALANERMEYIRSLSYDTIGTINGIPSGSLVQNESITLNNATFTRRTLIIYGDDSRDGLGAADTNSIPTDYKTAKVEVSWSSHAGNRSISLVSRFEPPSGLEIACSSPCGTLAFTVLDAASSPLSGARVDIDNTSVSPAVDLTTYTDSTGKATFLGAPVGSGYQVVVTKSGYSTAQTYASSGSNPSPNPPHVSVLNNQTSSLTFAIDVLTAKTVVTRLQSTGAQIAGIPFRMVGAKYIGSGPTVYKYDQTLGSGGTGTTTIPNIEWDTYTLSVGASTGYDIASSCAGTQPQYLPPNSAQETILYLAPHTTNSLLVDVKSAAGSLVPNASVRLTRTPSYDTALTSDSCGQAFFSSLTAASTYAAMVSASGFTTKNVTGVNVSGTTRLSVVFD